MQNIRDWSVRETARYCRRNLFFAHLTEGADRPDHWPEWTRPVSEWRVITDGHRLSVLLGEMARFLAITATVYLLVVIVVGIL